MKFTIGTILLWLLFMGTSWGKESDTQIINEVMRGIAIEYLINEDRKLPKKNRQKWEESFSDYIDFAALNSSMRLRVKEAIEKHEKESVNDVKMAYLAEKAVIFYLPKELTGLTIGYLKVQRRLGELPQCTIGLKPTDEEKVLICTTRISANDIQAKLLESDSHIPLLMFFKKTDKWRLTAIKRELEESVLEMIGMWK